MILSVRTGIPYGALASESDRVIETYFDVMRDVDDAK